MRAYPRRWAPVAAAAALAAGVPAAAVPAGGGPAAADDVVFPTSEMTGLSAVSGVVTRDGAALPGADVLAVAYPAGDALDVPEGRAVGTLVAGAASTDRLGRFSVNIDPAALPAPYAGERGQLNLEVAISDGAREVRWMTTAVRSSHARPIGGTPARCGAAVGRSCDPGDPGDPVYVVSGAGGSERLVVVVPTAEGRPVVPVWSTASSEAAGVSVPRQLRVDLGADPTAADANDDPAAWVSAPAGEEVTPEGEAGGRTPPGTPSPPPSRPSSAPPEPTSTPSGPTPAPSRPASTPSRPTPAPSRPASTPSRPLSAPSPPPPAPSRPFGAAAAREIGRALVTPRAPAFPAIAAALKDGAVTAAQISAGRLAAARRSPGPCIPRVVKRHDGREETYMGVYAWSGALATVTQANGADHTLSTGAARAGGRWSSNGSLTLTVRAGDSHTASRVADAWAIGTVNYGVLANGCDGRRNLVPLSLGDPIKRFARAYHPSLKAQCITLYGHSSVWDKDQARNVVIGGGVSVAGFTASAQSGYDVRSKLSFRPTKLTRLCGNRGAGVRLSSIVEAHKG
ncbi:hypothetical protein ABZU32_19470 [Sphaerisporangium sp. NPDC005288]|uniref:hypothetical protein n=1 Tax=Sphaerisporangium sp. NPDC005288 TaxID=3155114 RepID=UPI0033B558DC